jgi:hypothetical protein
MVGIRNISVFARKSQAFDARQFLIGDAAGLNSAEGGGDRARRGENHAEKETDGLAEQEVIEKVDAITVDGLMASTTFEVVVPPGLSDQVSGDWDRFWGRSPDPT